MGQMSFNRRRTDLDGVSIIGIPRRNMTHGHFLFVILAERAVAPIALAQQIAMGQGNLLRLDEIAAIRAAIDEHQKLTAEIEAQATAANDMQAAQEKAAQAAQEQADAMARPCEEASPETQSRYRQQIHRIFREAAQ